MQLIWPVKPLSQFAIQTKQCDKQTITAKVLFTGHEQQTPSQHNGT